MRFLLVISMFACGSAYSAVSPFWTVRNSLTECQQVYSSQAAVVPMQRVLFNALANDEASVISAGQLSATDIAFVESERAHLNLARLAELDQFLQHARVGDSLYLVRGDFYLFKGNSEKRSFVPVSNYLHHLLALRNDGDVLDPRRSVLRTRLSKPWRFSPEAENVLVHDDAEWTEYASTHQFAFRRTYELSDFRNDKFSMQLQIDINTSPSNKFRIVLDGEDKFEIIRIIELGRTRGRDQLSPFTQKVILEFSRAHDLKAISDQDFYAIESNDPAELNDFLQDWAQIFERDDVLSEVEAKASRE